MKLLAACAFAYAVVGFLAYGYSYHHNWGRTPQDRNDIAVFQGCFWPVFFATFPISLAADAAIAVTAPSNEAQP